jgi:hypothetical protein
MSLGARRLHSVKRQILLADIQHQSDISADAKNYSILVV